MIPGTELISQCFSLPLRLGRRNKAPVQLPSFCESMSSGHVLGKWQFYFMWYAQPDASGIFSCFSVSMNDFLPGCLFAVVVIKCFMIGVNV